ncbi:MAG: DNA helicase [Clostridia bacterium]|nr:DNA helicase [Clostridia bacterium]
MKIGEVISKAIKEGKWLNISYINKNSQNTFYWIAIKDIDFDRKTFWVSMFNDKKSIDTFETWIYFESIQSAEIIEFSSYERPDDLISKIEKNLDKCEWLDYDHFNHNILNYYMECSVLDNDPAQKEYACIPGIDLALLRKNKKFELNDEQIRKIIADIYHYDIKNNSNSYFTLAINCFSIDENKNKYVIAYYTITFDPLQKSLILDKQLRFNSAFMIDGRRHSLFNYINMDMDLFAKTFEKNFKEYQQIIQTNLRQGEYIDTRPDIMLIQRDVPIDLSETYEVIEKKYLKNNLCTPLKSFFGNITKRNNLRRKEPSLIIYDDRININQMRVLYNAMKYPVTYVQGPPGTGKTQTIINVTLSAFYNDRTMLICSSNNKPVDGIVEKLKFEYKGESVNFPYLRLGNYNDVKKATLRIKKLYNFNSNQTPKDELLNKIKTSTDDHNSKLVELLNVQEKRIDIQNCLDNSNKLINSFGNNTSKIIDIVKEKISQLKNDLRTLPEVLNEELTALFIPLTKNYQLSQFLYFKSLQYISKLKRPRYAELIEICNIEDDDTRVNEFNKWTQNDTNIKLLTEAFPIIFSTNISSRRLGTPEFMFDLVVMDEAGQCNVATALIPIAKAESLLLVGDPNQLKPVVILEESVNNELIEKYNVPEKYNYKNHSILDIMIENDNISKYILLEYHYRCGRKIINFSNQRYYNNSLNLSYIANDGYLQLLDVKNQNAQQKNEAFDEAAEIVKYIKRNNLHDAFIITPFVNQKELLVKMLQEQNITDIDCGTIHSLQGAEKDTIIFSSAISPKTSKNTFAWIKDNYELINVAVTRAKTKLIIAADTEIIDKLSDKRDDLYNLIQYAKNNGEIVVPANETIKIEIGKSNGSVNEDEFFKTVSHFCSCHKTFDVERNVKCSKLLKNETITDAWEFDLVLYEKTFFGKKPVIVFEVNGGEHFGSISREKADRKKIDMCAKYGIKLIFIPNAFVKAYEYIADIIFSLKNKNTTIQQSLFEE